MADRYHSSGNASPGRERRVKVAILRVCRALGLFSIARGLTAGRWRILCYHGFSIGDQHEYAPILFMRAEVFRRRMRTLQRLGMPVVSLDEGLKQLRAGSIRGAPVSITIDDGWKTTITEAAPVLRDFGFPACVYATTYYSERQVSVFNVVIWYMLWKTDRKHVELSGIHPQLDGRYDLSAGPEAVGSQWIKALESNFNADQREALLGAIAAALGLQIDAVLRADRFKLIDREEMVALVKDYGLDVQLHTHRHRLPQESAELMRQEIDENRRVLQEWTNVPSVHFCYPSGIYTAEHPQWLSAAGVESATTCDGGTNDASASPLLLKRYLDRDDWDDIEFEAVVTGFNELIEWSRRFGRAVLRRKSRVRGAQMKDAAIG